tara:strand:- start:39 stop:650 length:612 start_codon:yes stop_codon:yes gene_type:complete
VTKRKKKLILIQLTLFILGLIIAYFTYYNKDKISNREIVRENIQKKITEELKKKDLNEEGNVFYNIEYSGFDLQGNRYVLQSEEAITNNINSELIQMKKIKAIFYFKDDTILYIWSDIGVYNNKTLDMEFEYNVRANYNNSKLFAEKAEYSNSKGFLTITKNVRINSSEGNLMADKLLFDIKNQNLNIASFNNNKINANIKLK